MLLPQTDNWEYNLVDLGLSSGTLWADRNIGASSPEDYGLYFAWGETQGYSGITSDKQFSWTDYKYANGASNKLTKYCNNSSYGNDGFTDNLTELELSDDAAYGYTNGKCKMPTKAQFQEFIDGTTHTWTTKDGVNGVLYASKTNTSSIFIPNAGFYFNGDYYSDATGDYNVLLSSSLYEIECKRMWYLWLGTDAMDFDYYRIYGASVRGVKV